jgi:hypothetical protein
MQPLFEQAHHVRRPLVIAALADLAFAFGWGDLRMGLVWAVVVFTLASWVAYFFEGLRALRTVEAAPSA